MKQSTNQFLHQRSWN